MPSGWLLVAFLSLLGAPLLGGCTPTLARAEPETHGNWTSLSCNSDLYREWLDISASDRWNGLDTPDAWKDALAGWDIDRKRNDTSFSGSVSRTVGGYVGIDCGVDDKCLIYGSCGDLKGPAGMLILNSFDQIHRALISARGDAEARYLLEDDLVIYEGDTDPETPDENVWKPLLSEVVKIGSASAIGTTLYSLIQDNSYYTESGAVNPTDTAVVLMNTTMAVAQGWADGKWTGNADPKAQGTFAHTMNQAMSVWAEVAKEGLRRLFDGSKNSISNLHDAMADGKFVQGSYGKKNVTKTVNSDERPKLYSQTLYAFNIQAAWRLAGAAPFILDSGRDCGNNNTDGLHFKSSVTAESAGACVDGRQYYIVSAKDHDFSLLPFLEPTKYRSRWRGDGLEIDDLVTGSVRTYQANGNSNSNSSLDLTNSTTATSLIANGVRGAGLLNLPVCGVAVAYHSARKGNTSSPGYPCNEAYSAADQVLTGAAARSAQVAALLTAMYFFI